MVGVQGDEEVFYSRGNAGKRIDVCIASTLRDWGSYRWLVVEFHVNGQFVHFLVCGPPNLALTRRYHRFFTGAIRRKIGSRSAQKAKARVRLSSPSLAIMAPRLDVWFYRF